MADSIVRAMLGEGEALVWIIKSSDLVRTAREIHNLSNTATAALGRVLTAAAIMGSMPKDDDAAMTLTFAGGGPLGKVTVVALGGGVKGYVENPEVELPLNQYGKLDVGGGIGTEGRLTIVRDMGLREPYVGQVNLVSGEVAEDLAWYYATSEQQPSLVALSVRINKGEKIDAGGIIIQPMPGCSEEMLQALETRSMLMQAVGELIEEGQEPEEIMQLFFSGIPYHILETLPARWKCDCTVERIERALISLGQQNLKELIDEGEETEVCCQFCRTAYRFTPAQLKKLLDEAQ